MNLKVDLRKETKGIVDNEYLVKINQDIEKYIKIGEKKWLL
jgi:hypothetical protein